MGAAGHRHPLEGHHRQSLRAVPAGAPAARWMTICSWKLWPRTQPSQEVLLPTGRGVPRCLVMTSRTRRLYIGWHFQYTTALFSLPHLSLRGTLSRGARPHLTEHNTRRVCITASFYLQCWIVLLYYCILSLSASTIIYGPYFAITPKLIK